MTVYVLAQLSIFDRDAYDRYQARFMEVMRPFQGKVLAADEKPELIEGAWDKDKVVLLAFPDREAYLAWAESPEYQEIAKDRKAGASAVILLVRGLSSLSSPKSR